MSNKKIVGLTLAATAALAFTVIPAASFAASSAKVPCYGMNACKGQKSCKEKGAPGMKMMTEKHCKKMGGSTTAPEGVAAPAAVPAAVPAAAPAPTEAPAS